MSLSITGAGDYPDQGSQLHISMLAALIGVRFGACVV